MPLAPLTRYRVPRYPTRLELSADRDLLRRHLPPAWAAIPGTVLALLLDAGAHAGEAPPATPATGAGAIVAPLFKHGEGRGAFGCVAVSAPVFLSEEEAMAVIGEELKAKGVQLGVRNQAWADTEVSSRKARLTIPLGMSAEAVWKEDEKHTTVAEGPGRVLEVDGIDPNKRIAVEFVSHDDSPALGGYDKHSKEIVDENKPNSGGFSGSSVSSTDLADTAAHVDAAVRRLHKDRVFFAALYDPVTYTARTHLDLPETATPAEKEAAWKAWREQADADARRQSLDLLRLQVRDFIAWLEAQGAI